MKYDVTIIGAGPGGIFSAYELMKKKPELKIAVLKPVIHWRKGNVPLTETRLSPVSSAKPVQL